MPSTTSVAYPPTTTTSLPKSPASSGSVKLIDIDDPPAQAQPQPQQPSTENSAKKGSAGNEKEEEVAEDVLFSFEPLPPEVKDINVADDKQRLLGEEPDNNNSNNGEEEEKRAPKKKKQQQQPKKAGGNNGDGDNEDRMWYHMFYKVSFYKPYFNVDTVDVGERIFRALVPTKSFFETTGENPDLYGPFWITTTLLFALAISSNFSNYISYWMAGRESEWGYDFERVSVATAVFYPYITLAPLAVWLTQKYWLKLAIPFVSCMCVYGYSLSSYAIGTVITFFFLSLSLN